ncbi:Peroxin-3 domain-containing protein [Cephalotus follicularis]|uniref:Peroxin-3 domain-containing protein n=1 Tax=Cephalotus follicularis TaxID=3775 RepID=A0A1Q3CJY4_CEPFO|nr:Peroxin-3 domain-containing protein [Cephalotus follicularis]
MPSLISNMQAAAQEVLKGKHLRDFFSSSVLHEAAMQILDRFMSMESPCYWLDYLMPADNRLNKLATSSRSDDTILSYVSKFDQLMTETRAVLSSAGFGSVAEISLKAVLGGLIEDMGVQAEGGSLASGMPLAKLLPRIVQMCPHLLDEPSKNRFIQIIQSVPEVELFFTLLYANLPTS